MSYLALYRKFRPLVFEDVVEQEYVVRTLRNAVVSDRIAHAYLFCGTRGTGKTTMAQIFSRAINCQNPNDGDPCNKCEVCTGILSGNILDVIEIDAASNNSVDNIRDIRDEVIYLPTTARYKVYIIDEVHMLTTGAFNALLKTLEEPPSHVVFILATTEPHKLPATILSRCQRYDFKRISVESIAKRVSDVCIRSNVEINDEAARLIARMADGALRDALSILDQCMAVGQTPITYDSVLAIAGVVNDTFVGNITEAILNREVENIISFVDRLVMDGKDVNQFLSDLITYFRNILLCKLSDNIKEILQVPKETIERMQSIAKTLEQDGIIYYIKELSNLQASLKWATQTRILLEVGLVRIAEADGVKDIDGLLQRLSILEKKVSEGVKIAPTQQSNLTSGESKKDTEQNVIPKENRQPVISGSEIKFWNEFLGGLQSIGRMQLYTCLLNTKAVEMDEKFVAIVFPKGSAFQKTIVGKTENSEFIGGELSKRLGREVHVKCIEDAVVKEVKKDDIEQIARERAKRADIPFNVIEE